MKNKLSIICQILGIILIIVALGLCLYNVIFDYTSGKKSKEALEEIENILQEKPIDDSFDYLNNPNKEMPKLNIDGKNYIGIISIPSIDIELPVLNEYTVKNLKQAPVLYKGSIYQNNAIIIAHNSTSHFKKIQKLKDQMDEINTIANELKGKILSESEKQIRLLESKVRNNEQNLKTLNTKLSQLENNVI